MQIREVLSAEQIALLKSMARTRVFRAVRPMTDFHVPERGVSGRKFRGGSRPSDLSKSNILGAMQHAEAFGVRSRV